MLSRTEKGRLIINHLDLKIFLGDLMDMCKTKEEVDFVYNTICDCAELIAEETVEEKGL